MSRLIRFLREDRGLAAMEFALILPLLLAIIGGIVEYGRILFAENAIRAIIDERVRHAVVRNQAAASVEATVTSEVASLAGISDFDVSATDADCAYTITVTGSYEFIFAGLLPGDLRDIVSFTLTARYPRC